MANTRSKLVIRRGHRYVRRDGYVCRALSGRTVLGTYFMCIENLAGGEGLCLNSDCFQVLPNGRIGKGRSLADIIICLGGGCSSRFDRRIAAPHVRLRVIGLHVDEAERVVKSAGMSCRILGEKPFPKDSHDVLRMTLVEDRGKVTGAIIG